MSYFVTKDVTLSHKEVMLHITAHDVTEFSWGHK